MAYAGLFAIPVALCAIIFTGLFKKEKIFSLFCDGAKDGLKTVFSIAPALIGLVTAVEMFKRSGALDMLTEAVNPLCELLHLPAELVPLTLLRPVSGSGTLTLLDEVLKSNGADSFIGRVASVMCGSTDTTFYALTLYYGSCKIKNTRHTLVCSVVADTISIIMSILTVGMFLSI